MFQHRLHLTSRHHFAIEASHMCPLAGGGHFLTSFSSFILFFIIDHQKKLEHNNSDHWQSKNTPGWLSGICNYLRTFRWRSSDSSPMQHQKNPCRRQMPTLQRLTVSSVTRLGGELVVQLVTWHLETSPLDFYHTQASSQPCSSIWGTPGQL